MSRIALKRYFGILVVPGSVGRGEGRAGKREEKSEEEKGGKRKMMEKERMEKGGDGLEVMALLRGGPFDRLQGPRQGGG